jgi:hypothetical protein
MKFFEFFSPALLECQVFNKFLKNLNLRQGSDTRVEIVKIAIFAYKKFLF